MSDILGDLQFTTSVSLQGLLTGMEKAETEAKSRVARVNSELSKISFEWNVSSAVSSLERLTSATSVALANVRQLRAALAAPLSFNVSTSGAATMQRELEALRGSRGLAPGTLLSSSGAPLPSATAENEQLRNAWLEDERNRAKEQDDIWKKAERERTAMDRERERSSASVANVQIANERRAAAEEESLVKETTARQMELHKAAAAEQERFARSLPQLQGTYGSQFAPGSGAFRERTWADEFGGGQIQMSSRPKFMGSEVPNFGQAWTENIKPQLGDAASYLADSIRTAAVFTAIYGTMQGIHGIFSQTVTKGMEFNQQLEGDALALGALLSLDRQYQTSTGQTASQLAAYKASLSDAADVQEKLYDLDAKTLGTGQELVGVYQSVLAFSRGSKESEEQRLKFTSGFLNAAKVAHLDEQQTKIEARQILELQKDSGQTVLHMLGVSIQQARAWKEQGVYFEEMNKRLAVFNQMGDQAGNTWQGLSTTFQTISSRLAATTFGDTFSVTKEILAGINEEFRKMRENGEVVPALFGGDREGLKTFAADLAHGLKDVYGWTAGIANKFFEWGERLDAALHSLKQFPSLVMGHIDTTGEFNGLPSAPSGGAAGIFSSDPTLRALQDRLLAEHMEQKTENIDTRIQQQQAIVGALTGVNTAGLTGGIGGTFDKYLGGLDAAGAKVKELQDKSNALHGANVISDEDWKRQTADLKKLSDAIKSTRESREKAATIDPKAEKDTVTNRRNAAIAAAERAEAGVEKTAVGFTGDISAYIDAQERAIRAKQAQKIAAAKGDAATIAAINREAAAQTEKAWQDAGKLFIKFEDDKQKAVERTANSAIRSAEVETRGKTQLVDIDIAGTQRQIHFAELRHEPIRRVLDLYTKELTLTQQKDALETAGANKSLALVRDKLAIEDKTIADYDKQIAQLKTMTQTDATKGDILALEEKRQEIQDKRNDSLAQEQKLSNDLAVAHEREINKQMELEEKRRRLNPTFSEAVRDRVGESQYGVNKEYADIAIDGIHNIGHALTEMLNKGKLDWASLGNVARDVLTRIENKMLDRAIDQGIDWIMGKPAGQGGSTSGAQASTGTAAAGGLFNWLFGGGSASASTVTSQQKTSQTAGDAAFWNSVGLGDMASGTSGGSTGFVEGEWDHMTPGLGGMGGGMLSMLPLIMGLGGKGKGGGLGMSLGMGIGGMLLKNMLFSKGGIFGAGGSIFGQGGMGGLGSILTSVAGGLGTAAGGIMGTLDNIIGLGGATGAWGATGVGGLLPWLGSFFHDGGIVSHHMGLAPDEHYAKLQSGEMVLSRGETASLFRGGAARVPGGYRPDARIFMTNMSSAARATGNTAGGGDGMHVHNWHISTPDPHAFGYSATEIQRQGATAMNRASRRTN